MVRQKLFAVCILVIFLHFFYLFTNVVMHHLCLKLVTIYIPGELFFFQSALQVVVLILDINDNPPVFKNNLKEINLLEVFLDLMFDLI